MAISERIFIILFNSLQGEAVIRRFSVKKMFLEISQNSLENTSARVSFLIKLQAWACNVIKKETLAQVFSCEFYKISKNTFFTEHLWWLLLFKVVHKCCTQFFSGTYFGSSVSFTNFKQVEGFRLIKKDIQYICSKLSIKTIDYCIVHYANFFLS